MLSTAQHDRIARKCTTVMERAIAALPNLLGQVEAEAASRIIVDIMKIYIGSPVAQPDPAASLREAIEKACSMTDEEPLQPTSHSWQDSLAKPPADPAPPQDEAAGDYRRLTMEDLPPYEAHILSSPSHTWDD